MKDKSKQLWRSVADYENSPEFLEILAKEFPSGAKELDIKPGIERRKFLELIGASMALAGVMSTGCIRRPKEFIYPENFRPENTLPGVPKYYSTSARVASGVLGLSVTSTDGRPTKIDGNPKHPMNNPNKDKTGIGSSNAFTQAEILNLYDADRGRECRSNKNIVQKEFIFKLLQTAFKENAQGEGISILVESFFSPSFHYLLGQLKQAYPKISISEYNTTYTNNRVNGVSQLVGKRADIHYDISQPDVILSLDADFLGVEGDTVKHAREFAARRKTVDDNHTMNRLYSIEANLSLTGSNADHRFAINQSRIPDIFVKFINELKKLNLPLNDIPIDISRDITLEPRLLRWIKAVAKDLVQHKNRALVMVGAKQPSWMHSLGLLVNKALGALGQSVHISSQNAPDWLEDPTSIVKAYHAHRLKTLIMIGGNPVYSLPADQNFKQVVEDIPQSFYLGYFDDETAQSAAHYLPHTHFLESWGDTIASDGTYAIRQPLIAPLFDACTNEYEFIASLLQDNTKSDYEIVRSFCKSYVGNKSVLKNASTHTANQTFEDAWRTYLSTGFIENIDFSITKTSDWNTKTLLSDYQNYLRTTESKNPDKSGIELVFALSNTLYDGRYANNAWMQELPDPISKLVWDNALLMSPKTARQFNLSGTPQPGSSLVDMVTLNHMGRSLNVPVWVVPGIAENTGVLHLGYGSKIGTVAKKAGFNANQLRTSRSWFAHNVSVNKNHESYSLVTTQEHGSMLGDPSAPDKRTPAVRTASLAEYKANPAFVLNDEVLPVDEQKSWLFSFPKDESQAKWARQQWGMSIDLNSCIGCNACTIACQSENNISVVGKEQVFKSRVMNWIRIDRYFTGDMNNPELQTLFQPLNCQHCENAPCEAVCPVAATSHSPDGLNDMTYNRCVGTRYCANNCPYKVRRFNFFNYSDENDKNNPLYAMQKNPNVTIRFRGVMEKCTYCVQKINAAKNNANGKPIPDGEIVTACQSVCPTNAITFGDVANPSSKVSQLKALPRNYSVLGELNTRPRTTYLAKIRNINPEIG